MIKIYAQILNEKAVAGVADVLRSDGVIVYPTDSVYAFGCSIRSPKAIERLRALSGKKGDEFSIVCPDLSTISAYARVDNAVFKVLKRNQPGPFTFVLNAAGKVPDKFLEKRKTVGVRIPDHEFCRRILRGLGRPVVSTSANISGEATPAGLAEVSREIIDGVDFVVNPRFEGKPTKKASSIIAFGEGGEVKIIRE